MTLIETSLMCCEQMLFGISCSLGIVCSWAQSGAGGHKQVFPRCSWAQTRCSHPFSFVAVGAAPHQKVNSSELHAARMYHEHVRDPDE